MQIGLNRYLSLLMESRCSLMDFESCHIDILVILSWNSAYMARLLQLQTVTDYTFTHGRFCQADLKKNKKKLPGTGYNVRLRPLSPQNNGSPQFTQSHWGQSQSSTSSFRFTSQWFSHTPRFAPPPWRFAVAPRFAPQPWRFAVAPRFTPHP